MNLSRKNRPVLLVLSLFGLVIGTLGWEIAERIISLAGRSVDLSVGPIGLDLRVIAVSVRINPGSLLGLLLGLFVFTRL